MHINFPVQMIRSSVKFTGNWISVNIPCNNANGIYGGAIKYEYFIDKYEIPEKSIIAYNSDPANSTRQITKDTRGGNKPVTSISWNEAARFVNWLNETEGEQPAYNFTTNGANDNITKWPAASAWINGGLNEYRHKDAKYFIPSSDEWYKAAYFDPDTRDWYDYPTGSDATPVATTGGTASNTAVYNGSQVIPTAPADVTLAGGASKLGTVGQGGNVSEWVESAFDGTNDSASETRKVRGGNWTTSAFYMAGTGPGVAVQPTSASDTIGFRVAYAPVGTGSATPDTLFTFVDIGDANNPAYDALVDGASWGASANSPANGLGSVSYDFQMSKYAVRGCDIDAYNTDPLNATRQITPTNTAGFNNNPVVGFSFYYAARFVNWLNEAGGFHPAYKFPTGGIDDSFTSWPSESAWRSGEEDENLIRHKDTKYFIPSESEWIKAAYYDPNHGGTDIGGYWRYTIGGNSVSACSTGCITDGHIVIKSSGNSSQDFGRVDVDRSGGLSPFGTMGQGGNCYEWVDDLAENSYLKASIRGATARTSLDIQSAIDYSAGPYPNLSFGYNHGLRVARVISATPYDIGGGPIQSSYTDPLNLNS